MPQLLKKKLYGWAKSDFSKCNYLETSNIDTIEEIFKIANSQKKKISFRGGGRSYGDNTLNKNNIVLKYNAKKNIINFDETKGEIIISGSCRLLDLFDYIIPRGWTLHVSPASQYITIAGAISNNVHGKNCPSKGYFGDYVEEIEIYTPDKGLVNCSKNKNQDLFYAVISGLGSFGIILKAKITLRKINTVIINTKVTYVKSLDEAIDKSKNLGKEYEYNIGSLNFTRFNKNFNDGKIYSSNFSDKIDLKINNAKANLFIYLINSGLLLNKLPLIDNVIEFFFSKITSKNPSNKKKFYEEDYFSMNFLGDKYLPFYNNFFRNGFVEYQVIFDSENYLKAIMEIEDLIKKNGYSSYMSSFKIYKSADPKYILGLNKNGYCITLDIPFEKNKKFQKTTRLINEITIKYNGQVYLGKTPCLNNEEFKQMYKNHRKFEELKNLYDKNFLLVSDMTNRLFSTN